MVYQRNPIETRIYLKSSRGPKHQKIQNKQRPYSQAHFVHTQWEKSEMSDTISSAKKPIIDMEHIISTVVWAYYTSYCAFK